VIVGITMRTVTTEVGEIRDAIAHDWFVRLASFEVDAVLIPNRVSCPQSFCERLGVERIILTGGESLGPLGGEPGGPSLTERDRTEFALLDWAVRANVPTLAVCRGLQVTNVFFGGSITRSLERSMPSEKHRANDHWVIHKAGGMLRTNSYHDEGVLMSQVASNLDVFAWTDGGVVEGFRHRCKPILSVQWHPERASPSPDFDDALFKDWLGNKL
jgi:gamma-glutamyl-gamma-aminobutyrate hydrolase PuuD